MSDQRDLSERKLKDTIKSLKAYKSLVYETFHHM